MFATLTLLAATVTHAEVATKGGAAVLASAPAVQAQVNVRPAMSCPMCKSEFISVTAPTFKGTSPASTIVERHACPTCANTRTTTGHGKAKVESSVHTCGGCKS